MTHFISKTAIVFLTLVLFQCASAQAKIIRIMLAETEIKRICMAAPDPPSCFNILKNQKGTSSADRKGIAKIAISLAEIKTNDIIKLIKSLIGKTRNKQLLDRYNSCMDSFNQVGSALDKAMQILGSNHFSNMNEFASQALDQAENCDDLFEGPPTETSDLENKTKDAINTIGVVYAVSKNLP